MGRFLVVFLCVAAGLLCSRADPLWRQTFDQPDAALPAEVILSVPGRGGVAHFSVVPEGDKKPKAISCRVPLDHIRGERVFFGADVKLANVSRKPNSWNGVKVMLVIETPSGTSYPQAEVPEGTADWQRYSMWVAVPENTTNISFVLGLENVSGEAWFDNASISLRPRFRSSLKVDPSSPVFRGHTEPRLRGAMAGTDLIENDVKHFGTVWRANLLRLQLFEAARQDRPLQDYDSWLNLRLQHLDQELVWCEKYGVRAVVDLHSPPGGQAFSAGYITARGRIFTQPQAQEKFIQVWRQIAARYRGRSVIWGFDLVNEPDDSMLAEGCLDWNELADKAARAVRAIDPDRTLIIEPDQWANPQGFAAFEPLDLPGIVYSFHFYQPMQFTHQGIHNQPGGVTYPGPIGKEYWGEAALERAMQPAFDFARKYRVQMYVGEFSAIRTAPGNSAARYLADVIGLLERHGYDWSYHAYREWQGWSLEHEGPLNHPTPARTPTDREKVVTDWFARNRPGGPN